jgi:hypothetical protein
MAGGQQFCGFTAIQNRRRIENYKFYKRCQRVVFVGFSLGRLILRVIGAPGSALREEILPGCTPGRTRSKLDNR